MSKGITKEELVTRRTLRGPDARPEARATIDCDLPDRGLRSTACGPSAASASPPLGPASACGASAPGSTGRGEQALSSGRTARHCQFEAFLDQWCLIRPRCRDDDSQRLATSLATRFDALGCCDPGTCRNARSRLDHAERPVRDPAVDRASRVALCVRPWPRLGHAWISGRGKVAPIRVAHHDGDGLLSRFAGLGRDWWPRNGLFVVAR